MCALAGMIMHQGKFRNAWKKAWFVLDGAYLYQYDEGYKKVRAQPPHLFAFAGCLLLSSAS